MAFSTGNVLVEFGTRGVLASSVILSKRSDDPQEVSDSTVHTIRGEKTSPTAAPNTAARPSAVGESRSLSSESRVGHRQISVPSTSVTPPNQNHQVNGLIKTLKAATLPLGS